jgi:hypothetical protein
LALSCVCGSRVAFLAVISDTITAGWSLAVGSAGVGNSVGVGSTVITLLTGGDIDTSVSAQEGACGSASGVAIQQSVVALFTVIFDTITANRKRAVGSAGIGDSGREVSAVALFTDVQNSVSASWQFAVGSASGSLLVRVVDTQVALLVLTLDSITTFILAVGVATITIDVVSVVTSFTHQVINDTITTVGENASGSASVGGKGIKDPLVALFLATVNDAITAVRHSAVGSASIGQVIVVGGSVVALLSNPGSISEGLDVLLDSISAGTS